MQLKASGDKTFLELIKKPPEQWFLKLELQPQGGVGRGFLQGHSIVKKISSSSSGNKDNLQNVNI